MFEWQIGEETEEIEQLEDNGRKWSKWLLFGLALLILVGGWVII